ncbi:hypothetical protein AB6A40_010641 [Gnathostoma spinigerum]|uniref:ABC transmembrane type-1 domain-containing protein n=1 Tax=Gnathostoma spinigerum TaxID=75299 RepID=A0ABD6F331_9BILA
MPVFSIVFGQMFNTFSLEDEDQLRVSAFINSLAFVVLGIIQGTSAFICIALYGTSGERLTMRMRLLSMKSLLRQDVSYFDDPRHTPGKLTTRLASDAPNVKSAIDQRMASIVQGVISLVSGLAVAFFFGWQMSFITLLIYIALFATQILLNRLVANRDERDIRSAENAGKIAIESIENIRTVQALTKESYLHSLFVRSMQRTHR